MNKECNSGAPMAIFLASLILIAITAKAEEKTPKIENMEHTKLIWTSDCPTGMPSTNGTNLCKKKIYADDSIDISKLKWEEVEDIARLAYDWKQKLRAKFAKNKQ